MLELDLNEDGEINELGKRGFDDVEQIDREREDGDEVDEFEPHDLFSLLIDMDCL